MSPEASQATAAQFWNQDRLPADFSYRLKLELPLTFQQNGQGTEGSEWRCLRDACMTVGGGGGGEVNAPFFHLRGLAQDY